MRLASIGNIEEAQLERPHGNAMRGLRGDRNRYRLGCNSILCDAGSVNFLWVAGTNLHVGHGLREQLQLTGHAIAQRVAGAGVTSILSFAPTVLHPPEGVKNRRVDIAVSLGILAYQRAEEDRKSYDRTS